MKNAELIATIRNEIERLKSIEYPCDNSQQATGFFNALDRMTDFLSTLEEQECPEYCIRSHCIGCSKYNPDEWSNEPRRAKIRETGEIVEGFTDGQGHFDVFTDHNVCNRYDVNAVEFDTLESEKPINPEAAMKELDEKIALVKQRKTWDGVDVDKYMDEVRGREPENPMVLEEEVKRYYSDNLDYISSDQPTLSILTNIARHFTDWQKEQDTRDMFMSDNRHFNKVYELGKKDMKEQMMKEAVDAKFISMDEGIIKYSPLFTRKLKQIFRLCDKVRVIVLPKED